MADDWYVSRDGKRYGPMSAAQLRKLAAAGKVRTSDLLWKDGMADWIAAKSVKGLLPRATSAKPSRVPPPVHRSSGIAAPPKISDEETSLWTGRPSQVLNILPLGLCVILYALILSVGLYFGSDARTLLRLAIIPILIGSWRCLDTYFMSYELTNQRLRVKEGVLSRRIEEMELYRVKDTVFDQPFFLRLFGLATLTVFSSDVSTRRLLLEGIADGQRVGELIRNHSERMRDIKRVREIDVS